jgi:hypothetical protein
MKNQFWEQKCGFGFWLSAIKLRTVKFQFTNPFYMEDKRLATQLWWASVSPAHHEKPIQDSARFWPLKGAARRHLLLTETATN